MNTPLPRRVGLTLAALGLLVYLNVAVLEWRLGSLYHTLLALALAAFFGINGAAGRSARTLSLGTALVMGLVLAYGLFRAAVDLRLLGTG